MTTLTSTTEIGLRRPEFRDGFPIHQLIQQSPPLDLNSVYNYHLLTHHFADTCVVAEAAGSVVGFLSAYLIPGRPDTLFVWQVVVDASQRGLGLAGKMLDALLQRPACSGVHYLEATVNPSNGASRRLFERQAQSIGSTLQEHLFLAAEEFGPGAGHESEILLRIPLTNQANH